MASVTCVGGAVLDSLFRLRVTAVPGTSNPATAVATHGGVARNVAENLALLDVPVRLCSAVGADGAGRALSAHLAARGVDLRGVRVDPDLGTAQYVAVLDPSGELVLGAAAMDVLETVTAELVVPCWPPSPGWLFLEANLRADLLRDLVERAGALGTPVAVDAVSTAKAVRLAGRLAGIRVLFCNADEAAALVAADHLAAGPSRSPSGTSADRPPETLAEALVGAGVGGVVLTRGARGVLVADAGGGVRNLAALPAEVADVTGAGDALVAGTIAALLRAEARDDAVPLDDTLPLDDAAAQGLAAAALTLAVVGGVRPDLRPALVRAVLDGVGGPPGLRLPRGRPR